MGNENRIKAIGKRVHKQDEEKPAEVANRRERGRHTLYLDRELVARVDQAFKQAAHDLYPQEIEKADYLETCLEYALAHPDDIKTLLIPGQQG